MRYRVRVRVRDRVRVRVRVRLTLEGAKQDTAWGDAAVLCDTTSG